MLYPALILTRKGMRNTTLRQFALQFGLLRWLTTATANAANRFSVSTGNWNFTGRWMRFRRNALVWLLLLAGLFLFASDPALAATKTSAATGNWNTAGTWSPSGVPASGDDVIIASGHTVTVNGTFTCASLQINTANATAFLTFAASGSPSLTVTGAVTNGNSGNANREGSITFTSGSTLICGSITNGTTGAQTSTINMTSGGTLQTGSIAVSSTGATFTPGAGTVILTATNTLPATVFTTFNNLTINAGTTTPGVDFTVSTNLTIDSGATLNVAAFTVSLDSATVNVNGTLDFTDTAGFMENSNGTSSLTMGASGLIKTADITGLGPANNASLQNNGTTFTTSSIDSFGTVEYNRTSAQTVTDRNYNNLTFTNGGTLITSKTWTRTGTTRTVNGNVTINSGAWFTLAGNFSVNINGNWSNSGIVSTTTGTVAFTGTTAQTISGSSSTAFSGLTIANTGGGSANMTTSGSVSGVLTLTSDLTVTSPAICTQSGTSAGAGDVVGTVRRSDVGTTTRAFGNPNVQITNAGTATQVDVTLTKNTTPGGFAAAVKRVYTIQELSGSVNATLRLHYLDSELNSNTDSLLTLWRGVGTPSAVWTDQGTTGITRNTTASDLDATNNFVQKTLVTAFSSSPWTLANPATSAPTAVRMIGAQAVATNDGVQLRWRTGHEVNNLGFRVYREVNGQRTLVTKSVIAGSALSVGERSTLTAGRSYRWFDEDGSANAAYWLEDLDLNGTRTWHGPFTPFGGQNLSNQSDQTGQPGQSKGGRRIAINANSAQNSTVIEQLGRDTSADAKGTHDLTPVGSMPDSYLAAAVRSVKLSAKGGDREDSLKQQLRMLGGERAVKLGIKQEGWYRVTQPELIAAGLDPQADPRGLRLYVDGLEVPIVVNGAEDGRFDAADTVEFYGMGLDTPTTDTRVYWLLADKGAGARVRRLPLANGSPVGASFMHTVERRDRETYIATLLNGSAENFFGAIVTPSDALDQTLRAPSVALNASGNATLEVLLQGVTTGPHVTNVKFNGASLGAVNFSGQGQGVQRFTIPQSQVLEGINTVMLQNTGGAGDYSLVAALRLTFARMYQADNDALTVNVPAYQQVTIGGFTDKGVRVFDVTDERNIVQLQTDIKQLANGFCVTATPQGNGQRRLLAFNSARLLIPADVRANKPSRWLASSNRADLLVITHNTLASEFAPLAALRRSQGLRVEVVDIEDVYDEISFGHKTTNGLSEFLAFAANFWNGKPRYVLLAGDASYDPRNYNKLGDSDLVPTRLVDAGTLETASDDSLVDFDGDGLPDLTVGRLPARNAAEAHRMVERLMNYDKAAMSNETVLVADRTGEDNFESLIESLKAQLPAGQTATLIYRSQLDDATAHTKLIEALNRGPRVVNYFGHGSFDLWNGDLLTVADASVLQNGNKPSVYVMMTCLTGYFLEPGADGLAESLLKSTGGGAIAVWAGTGYTEAAPQGVMDQSVFSRLFKSGQLLGDAMRQAKSATTDTYTRLTWILFGDPTMRLR